ncbi:MAG: hypothetical protein ACREJQ_06665, partial [bacterium]
MGGLLLTSVQRRFSRILRRIALMAATAVAMGFLAASAPSNPAPTGETSFFSKPKSAAEKAPLMGLWKFADPARFAPARDYGWSLFGLSTGNRPVFPDKRMTYTGGLLFSESGAALGVRSIPSRFASRDYESALPMGAFGRRPLGPFDYGYLGGPANRAMIQNFAFKEKAWSLSASYTEVGRNFQGNSASIKGDGIDSAPLAGQRGQANYKLGLKYAFTKALNYSVDFDRTTVQPVAGLLVNNSNNSNGNDPNGNNGAPPPPAPGTMTEKTSWKHALKYTLSPKTSLDFIHNADGDRLFGSQKRDPNSKDYFKAGLTHAFSKTLKLTASRDFTATDAARKSSTLSNTLLHMDWAASKAFTFAADFGGKSPSDGKWERNSSLKLTSSLLPRTKLTTNLKLGDAAASGSTVFSTYGLETAIGSKSRPLMLQSGYTVTDPEKGATRVTRDFSLKRDILSTDLKTSLLAEIKSNAVEGSKPTTDTIQHLRLDTGGFRWLKGSADLAVSDFSSKPDTSVSMLTLTSPVAKGVNLSSEFSGSSSADGKSQTDRTFKIERTWGQALTMRLGYRNFDATAAPDAESPFFEGVYNTGDHLPDWAKPIGLSNDKGPLGDAQDFGYRLLPVWVASIKPGFSMNFQPKDPKTGRVGNGWSLLQPFGDTLYLRGGAVAFGKDANGNLVPAKESLYEVGHAVSRNLAVIARYSTRLDQQKREEIL